MINGYRLIVVMPAFNAEQTLVNTYQEIPLNCVDDVVLVDDGSEDGTVALARRLGIHTYVHPRNRGYGGNQKTCYEHALRLGADVVVMVHPDGQHFPRIIPQLAAAIADNRYDVVIGSRMLGTDPRSGGMPSYKYFANRCLTMIQNLVVGAGLSEYHSGFRAFSRNVLETLPLHECSDDFVFDNEILTQAVFFGFRVGEIGCPTRYLPESSSIGPCRAVRYGFGVLRVSLAFIGARLGVGYSRLFSTRGRRLTKNLI